MKQILNPQKDRQQAKEGPEATVMTVTA